jgi:multidrug efflux pump
MLLGTLLTLFVVPTVYTYIARKKPFEHEAPVAAQPHPAE